MRWENYPDHQDREMLGVLCDDFDDLYYTMPGVQECYEWCVDKWIYNDAPEYKNYVGELDDRMHPGLFDVINSSAEYDVEASDIRCGYIHPLTKAALWVIVPGIPLAILG